MKRREFITLLGGAAAAWPLGARAQQTRKLPTIGFLGPSTPSAASHWAAAFVQRLRELGWVEGRNIAVEYLALATRLPTMYGYREQVERGGLISYGANFPNLFRHSADYVDKILRGMKPADLPIEQPTKFDLVINLTTARALGLTISKSFLVRANEVIE